MVFFFILLTFLKYFRLSGAFVRELCQAADSWLREEASSQITVSENC